ncbi:MAG: hypothetical protein AUI97_04875 [Crenarchaeota archaeon 13_1_40CM_3_52_17]|nr:MAG: hypothetical protein AUI97_04875 [Crenarchaeota archaeon 13_1_40CM_3_52_17]
MAEPNSRETRPARTPAIVKTLVLTLFVSAILFSGWTLLKYLHYASVPGYIQAGIKLSISNLQIEIAIAGLIGLLTSLFLRSRRRSRKAKTGQLKMTPMTFGIARPSHPLMMTQRPSRDASFVIRKTRNRGRISRNRMGERLPPSYVVQPDSGNTN